MLELELNIKCVLAIENSYLHKYVKEIGFPEFKVINGKTQLIKYINSINFDIFLANGLPYILPVTKLKAGNSKRFINIHPSYLPDLKGADPIPGALLFERDSGATCHEMDDGIDTGGIISQFKIQYDKNLDSSLLYLLCFKAEVKVFEIALAEMFEVQYVQEVMDSLIYYTLDNDDRIINETDSVEQFLSKVRAFSNQSKGALLTVAGKDYLIYSACKLNNESLKELFATSSNKDIIFKYENSLLLKWQNSFIRIITYKLK
ncbi:formyltransferase family protein [Vicingaceae bacterium]|nr:formyltransferase family protein [Vicingaceae bacterium]